MMPGRRGYGLLFLFFILSAGCSNDAEKLTSDDSGSTVAGAGEVVMEAENSGTSGNVNEPSTSEREAANPTNDPVVFTESAKESDKDFRSDYDQRLKSGKLKSARIPMRSDGPKSMDPVRGSTVYENQCSSQLVETLLQYKYLKRPFEAEPLLLAEMPTSEDGLTWHFKLKDGVYFHDDGCFPDGKGRALKSEDVFYSWKRIADTKGANSKV